MADWTLRQAQQIVDEWIRDHAYYWQPLSNMLRITEEVGELARVVNDEFGEKKKGFHEPSGDIGGELADILFAMICLANSLHLDLQKSFETAIDKYTMRDSDRWKSPSDEADLN